MEQNNAKPPRAPEQDISQQAAVRRQKLADLRAAGQDPLHHHQLPPGRILG